MLSEFALPLDFTLLSACIFLNYRPEWRPFRISERGPYRSVSIAFSEHEKRPEIIWISSPNYGGDGGSRTHVQEYFRKTFSERSRVFDFTWWASHGRLTSCYPVDTLTMPVGHARVFLHKWCRILCLQTNSGRHAGLNYAASAKLLFVLAFLFNGYFLRGSPPQLAYPRSTHLSKPVRPHELLQMFFCRIIIIVNCSFLSSKLSV